MSSVDKGITLVEITFSRGNVICGQRYNIIRDNIQRAMSSMDKGITLLEITFSGQCHLWTKGISLLEITFSGQCHQWAKV